MIEIYAIKIESNFRPTEYGYVVDIVNGASRGEEGSYMTSVSDNSFDLPINHDEFIRFIDKHDSDTIDRIVTNNIDVTICTLEGAHAVYSAYEIRNIIMGVKDEIHIHG